MTRRTYLAALAVILACSASATPSFAGKLKRAAEREDGSIALDFPLDPPDRDAVAGIVDTSVGSVPRIAENPLELEGLQPSLRSLGADDPLREAARSGDPAEFLRAVRVSGRQPNADDDVQQELLHRGLEAEESEQRWQELERLRQKRGRENAFLTAAAKIRSTDELFDGTGAKRQALFDLGVRVVHGPKDRRTGRSTVVSLEGSLDHWSPRQRFLVGKVYRDYVQSLKKPKD